MPLAEPSDAAARGNRVPLPRRAPWPEPSPTTPDSTATLLPVPAQNVFEIREGLRAVLAAGPPAHRTVALIGREAKVAKADRDEDSRGAASDKRHARLARRPGAAHVAAHLAAHLAARGGRSVEHAHRGPLKHLVQVKRRHV